MLLSILRFCLCYLSILVFCLSILVIYLSVSVICFFLFMCILWTGGYNFANTARFWTLCTGLALGQELTNEIPEHKVWITSSLANHNSTLTPQLQYFPEYGPSYQLDIPSGNRANRNTAGYVSQLIHTISGHLSNLPHPSSP